jgi:hypothetical protein
MATASIFTATDAVRPLHEHQLASDLNPQSKRAPIPDEDQEKQLSEHLQHRVQPARGPASESLRARVLVRPTPIR